MIHYYRSIRPLSFGISLVSGSLVSFKLSLWGYARWEIHLPDRPILNAFLLSFLLVIPWLLIIVKLGDAAADHGIAVHLGADEDEAALAFWDRANHVMEESFGWLFSRGAHPISYGLIGGGAAGFSIALIKIVLARNTYLTLGFCLVVNLLLIGVLSGGYWKFVARRIASGLSETLENSSLSENLGSADDKEYPWHQTKVFGEGEYPWQDSEEDL